MGGRWREDVVLNGGGLGYVQRSVILGSLVELPTKRDAQTRLDEHLRPINTGAARPQSSMSFGSFAEDQWKAVVLPTFKRSTGYIVPQVFFRDVAEGRGGDKKPQPILAFYKAWKAACRAAGCPGRIPHDLRRTAVRNLVRAAVPERVAMQLTGHKTASVFNRYNITSPGDLRDAARALDAATLRAKQG